MPVLWVIPRLTELFRIVYLCKPRATWNEVGRHVQEMGDVFVFVCVCLCFVVLVCDSVCCLHCVVGCRRCVGCCVVMTVQKDQNDICNYRK